MGKILSVRSLILIYCLFLIPLFLQFQNCTDKSSIQFFGNRQSLTSSATGGGTFDGKPENGYYCRVFDDIQCHTQVKDIQGLMNVDNSGIHLTVDNCASTSFNFLGTADSAVTFTSLMPDYVGLSRGIFKKCEVSAGNIPLPPTEMADAYCTSEDGNTSVVVNKNIQNKIYDFKVVFRDGGLLRSTTGNAIIKTSNSFSSNYSSQTEAFTLTLFHGDTQTVQGKLETIVDQKSWNTSLNCRQASPQPTVIIENDMEISSTWIDTTQLVGYWKLNEANAIEGTTIVDSSRFASSGTLFTGNDGLNKSDMSAKGGAISLDGTVDSVRVLKPTDGHLDFGTGSFSYMVWIRKTGSIGRFDMPLNHGGGDQNTAGFDIECGNACSASISDGTGIVGTSGKGAQFFFDDAPFIGRWVLLVAVVDRSNQQFRAYVDGNLVSTNTSIAVVGSVNTNKELRFGGTDLGRFPFWGSIDDVAIWNRALSDSEILEIFQRLRPKFY